MSNIKNFIRSSTWVASGYAIQNATQEALGEFPSMLSAPTMVAACNATESAAVLVTWSATRFAVELAIYKEMYDV